MKPLTDQYLNVVLDCAGLVVAIVLTTIVVSKTSKSLASFFILPAILLGVHVYGNTVQELELGPEWIRNHLHNTGVAGISMIWAMFFTLLSMRPNARFTRNQMRIKTARYAMNMSLFYWIFSTCTGVAIEILTVTIWGEDSKAAGYSGELDWFDLSAYAVGLTIVVTNYLWLKPRVIAKMRQRYGVYA